MPRKQPASTTYTKTEGTTPRSAAFPVVTEGIGSRIAALADAIGTRKSAADAAGVSVDSLQRYIRGENMPPFDSAAQLCMAANARMEWLAFGLEPMLQDSDAEHGGSQDLSAEHLNVALELAEETLRGLWLPRRRYADLLALIYEGISKGLPYAEILAFTKPIASKMAGGSGDVGEEGVGEPSASGPGGGKAKGPS